MGVDEMGVDKMRVDEMGVDKMRVDEMGVDEMGTYHKKKLPTGKTIKGNLGFHCTFICPFC